MNQQKNKTAALGDKQDQLTRYGFRMGRSGAHASRTMMLDELQTLLDAAPSNASKPDYLSLVVDANLLGKGTAKARQLTAKHSSYWITSSCPLSSCSL